jgi:hypothetical protein
LSSPGLKPDILVAEQAGGEDLGRTVQRKLQIAVDLHRHQALVGLGIEPDRDDPSHRDPCAAHRCARLQAADVVEPGLQRVAVALAEARQIGGLQREKVNATAPANEQPTSVSMPFLLIA